MMKKKFDKKGEVEIQFNWIFILIAGGLILSLFVTIIFYQKGLSDKKISADLLDRTDSLLSGARISVGTDYKIKTGSNIPLMIDCERFTLKDSEMQGKRLTFFTLFSMQEQSGDNLYVSSRSWMSPYLVDYVLYLTSDQVRYTIITGTSNDQNQMIAEELYDELPRNAVKEKTSNPEAMVDRNHNTERIITINQNIDAVYNSNPKKPSKIIGKNKKISIVNIKGLNDINEAGEFEYWEYRNGVWIHLRKADSIFVDLPTLIGAVYSDHDELYEFDIYRCNMQKLMLRLNMVSSIYINKSQSYAAIANSNRLTYACAGYYSASDIIAIQTASRQANTTTFNQDAFIQISKSAENLRTKNQRLQTMGCPPIY